MLWAIEKMLVTSIFSIAHNVSDPFQKELLFLSCIYFSSTNALNLDQSRILLFGKDLTHYQTTNFRLVQIESLQKTIINLMKIPECSLNGWKTLLVKEKLLVISNLSFSQCFQKACFPGESKGVIVWKWVNDISVYW